MNRLSMVALAAASIVLAGCGHGPKSMPKNASLASSSPQPAAVAGVQGFMATGASYVEFLQWQGDSGPLTGTLNDNRLQGTPPNQKVASTTDQVAIVSTGHSLSLDVNGTKSYGSLAGDVLTLNVTQADGTIAPTSWTRATPDEYNNALLTLQGGVSQGNDQQAQANDEASRVQALGYAADSLTSAISDLQHSTDGLHGDLTGMDTDTATAVADAAAVAREQQSSDTSGVCSDAGGVASDAGGVASDAGGIESDASAVSSSVTSAKARLATLRSALASVLALEPNYAGSARTPSPADVRAFAASVETATASALHKTNQAIDHANSQVALAYAAANRADKTGGCGNPSQKPDPVQHIR